MGLMVTDGGPHPPEKWAADTASHIVDIAASASPVLYNEGMMFRQRIIEVLTHHHGHVQGNERSALQRDGSDRLVEPIDHDMHVEDAMQDILDVASRSSFADHFASSETQQYLADVLHSQFHETVKVERSWHADGDPEHPNAIAFRAVMQQGHALLEKHDKDLTEHAGRELVSAMILNAIPKRVSGS